MLEMLAIAMLMGCGGGASAPSCQDAIHHYYSAGCKFIDPQTGRDFAEIEVIGQCKSDLANAPRSCSDELADLRRCEASVVDPVKVDADCDCSAEQDALLTCG